MDAGVERWRRIVEGGLGVPATDGNRIDILRNGDRIFPAMLNAIRKAERTVDVLTYVYWTGDIARQFATALCERARAGLRVRILLDAIGAAAIDRDLIDDMNEAGCHCEWYRPPTTWKVWEVDHRTHRKVLVCDGAVGFTGGVGIAEEWEGDARHPGEWRETHVRVEGPAVDGLRAAFITNWRETGQPLFDDRDRFVAHDHPGDALVTVLRCPAQIGWTDLHTMFGLLIDQAQESIRLTTAYFVPDEQTVARLISAAQRGVDITLLLPGRHADKRVVQLAGEKEFEPLLDAGINIWNYQRSMLHAKVMTVDGCVATVGSGNLDQRSMRLNDECNLILFDRSLTAELDEHFADDLTVSEQLEADRWNGRGPMQRAKEAATDVFDHKL
ncbi:MAG TPA: phospholipase D-like domain-containing protein [Euzebyales bacterium]|nr:phospholipase D-like domain-containing protein [Euzebyales bacterium]